MLSVCCIYLILLLDLADKGRGELNISEYGIKIKNISAGMLYDINLGIRDYFTYTDAMLNNSLFSYFLMKNGLNIYRGKKDKDNIDKENVNESTRDIVCLDFDFGSRSYEKEIKRLNKLLNNKLSDESRERIEKSIKKIESNKELYDEKKRGEIRDLFYNEGVDITYKIKNKDGSIKDEETIHYKMLFRTSAKAKIGQVIFINEKLYDKAYDWLTMGLGSQMNNDNAKIVELSAYAPLTTSTIVDTIHIPTEDVLIVEDQKSFFTTLANVVECEEYETDKGVIKKKCVVNQKEVELSNTIWDGMGIIESDYLPSWVNGMALMRNHFFKTCAMRGNIQLFFKDYCKEHGYDYDTFQVKDIFGKYHYAKDIKMITTDQSTKWIKFINLMGGSLESAYEYWCERLHADGDIWGIVKTDHPSKLGEYQQLSYQMINTLLCTKEDIQDIASTSIKYVESLKNDNNEFEKFLRKNANEINHYEMLADLYVHNNEFANSKWFRGEKSKVIKDYVKRLRKGKIFVKGDNLTVFGNPYGLLLHAVGDDWRKDDSFYPEKDSIQCYTPLFKHDEYLAAFRNPHNSPNNICYMHNMWSNKLNKYFKFSNNIVAINCIGTDIQDRANGMDEDSDFMLFTNQETMVESARKCYKYYPTIVNNLKESGIKYNNTKTDYSNMDNKFSGSKMGIGWSSNLAQLAITYYWTELNKESPDENVVKDLYDNFIILSVLAQVIIDGCKREYEINADEEIKRIAKMDCMTLIEWEQYYKWDEKPKSYKHDLPQFMKYVKEITVTKNGKELSYDEIEEQKYKLKKRINYDLVCPMNWLEECLDSIQGASTSNTTPTSEFFVKMNGKPNSRQISKIRCLIEKYDVFTRSVFASETRPDVIFDKLLIESRKLLDELSKIKISNIITINRLIEVSLGLSNEKGLQKNNTKYTRKTLNYLYKMNKEKFLINFKAP